MVEQAKNYKWMHSYEVANTEQIWAASAFKTDSQVIKETTCKYKELSLF